MAGEDGFLIPITVAFNEIGLDELLAKLRTEVAAAGPATTPAEIGARRDVAVDATAYATRLYAEGQIDVAKYVAAIKDINRTFDLVGKAATSVRNEAASLVERGGHGASGLRYDPNQQAIRTAEAEAARTTAIGKTKEAEHWNTRLAELRAASAAYVPPPIDPMSMQDKMRAAGELRQQQAQAANEAKKASEAANTAEAKAAADRKTRIEKIAADTKAKNRAVLDEAARIRAAERVQVNRDVERQEARKQEAVAKDLKGTHIKETLEKRAADEKRKRDNIEEARAQAKAKREAGEAERLEKAKSRPPRPLTPGRQAEFDTRAPGPLETALRAQHADLQPSKAAAEQKSIDALAQEARDKAVQREQVAAATSRTLAADKDYADATYEAAVERERLAAATNRALLEGGGGGGKPPWVAGPGGIVPPEPPEPPRPSYVQERVRREATDADLAAALDEERASSQRYRQANTTAAEKKLQLAAALDQERAVSQAYRQASVAADEKKLLLAAALDQERAGSAAYLRANVRAAEQKNLLTAALAEQRATDQNYLASVVLAAEAKNREAAASDAALAEDEKYIASTARAAAERLRRTNLEIEALTADEAYIAETVTNAAIKARLSAVENEALAASAAYLEETVRQTVSKKVLANAEAEALAVNQANIAASVRQETIKIESATILAEAMAADQRYAQASLDSALVKARNAAAEVELLASNQELRALNVRLAVGKAEQAALLAEELAASRAYTEATARLAIARAQTAADQAQELAASEAYQNATLRAAVTKAQTAAAEAEALLTNQAYIDANVRTATAKNAGAVAASEARLADTAYTQSVVAAAETKLREAAASNELLLASNTYIETLTQQVATGKALAAAEAEARAVNAEYIAATARIAAARKLEATNVTAAGLGLSQEAGEDAAAYTSRIEVEKRVAVARERRLVNEAILANEAGQLDDIVAERVSHERLNQLVRERVAQETAAVGAGAGRAGGGGIFQRLRQGGTGADAGPGGVLGRQIVQTAGYAAGAAVVFSLVSGVKELVQSASELEKSFSVIRTQLGGNNAEFKEFRAGILDIARDTGVAAVEVAALGQQVRGAFQDNDQALINIRSAAQVQRVTGLSLEETTNALSASALAFYEGTDQVADSFERVGNLAVVMQQRTGVSVKETVAGLGTLGPIADSLGLNAQQTAGLLDTVSKYSARSAAITAEGLARVLPLVGQQSAAILALYSQSPDLAGGFAEMAENIQGGDLGKVLQQLMKDWDNLTKAQQNNIIALLGGAKNAQFLSVAFGHADEALRNMNEDLEEAGALNRYFSALQETLAQRIDRLAEAFRQIGQSIYDAGLSLALKEIVLAAGLVLTVVGDVAELFATLNKLTHGVTGQVLTLVAALKLLQLIGLTGGVGPATLLQAFVPLGARGAAARGAAASGFASGSLARLLGRGGAASGQAALAARLAPYGVTPIAAGGAAGAAGSSLLGPALVAAGGYVAVKETPGIGYDATKQKVSESQAEMVKRLKKLSTEQLKALQEQYKDKGGWGAAFKDAFSGDFGSLGIKVFGQEEIGTTIKDILAQRRKSARDRKAARGGFSQKEIDAAIADGELAITDLDALGASFKAGDISATKYLEGLRKYQRGFAEATKHGPLTGDLAEAATEVSKLINDTYSAQAQRASEIAINFAKVSGADVAQVQYDQALKNLQNPEFKSPELRQQNLDTLLTAQKEILEKRIKDLQDAGKYGEAAALAASGATLDPAAVAAYKAAIAAEDPQWESTIKHLKQSATDVAAIVDLIERGYLKDAQEAIEVKIKQLQSEGFNDRSATEANAKKIAKLRSALSASYDAAPIDVPGVGVDAAARKAADDLVAQKNFDAEIARIEQLKAQARDPREQAALDLRLADVHARQARYQHDQAGAIRAVTERLNAQRASQEAQRDLIKATSELFAAQLAFTGDTVGVAQEALKQANEDIAFALSQGVGADSAEMKRLQATAIQKQADVRDATLSKREADIDFRQQMGYISAGQAAAELQAIVDEREFLQLREDQVRDLMLKIKQLRDSAATNAAFNLPANIKLPTLYEVRRLNQSINAGIGYQDNRQVSVQIINQGTNQQQAVEEFVAVLNAPPRNGYRVGLY